MKIILFKITGLSLILTISLYTLSAFQTKPTSNKATVAKTKSIYDFNVKTIEGKTISLSKFKGKKILIVNVASKCGYTPQYQNLEMLYETYKSKLVILGFPANNFGQQEPGSNTEIQEFCTKNYGVTFQMMDKISVKGSDMHPLYKWLSTKSENGVCAESPNWNFCKYLINEQGVIIGFYKSDIDPLAGEITNHLQ